MKRVWTTALIPVIAVALAGCSDNGDEPQDPVTVTETVSEAPSTPNPTPSPTEAPTPTPTETSAPPSDPSGPPTTYAEAEAHLAAASAAGGEQQLGRFQSADGKFYCTFKDKFIPPSCEILDAIHDPETCADSPSPGVGRMELTRNGWAPQCNTDTIRQPGAAVVAEQVLVTWPTVSVECVIEGVGLTCLSTDDHQGFFLGPGRYQVF